MITTAKAVVSNAVTFGDLHKLNMAYAKRILNEPKPLPKVSRHTEVPYGQRVQYCQPSFRDFKSLLERRLLDVDGFVSEWESKNLSDK
jgi:hypothetical protein